MKHFLNNELNFPPFLSPLFFFECAVFEKILEKLVAKLEEAQLDKTWSSVSDTNSEKLAELEETQLDKTWSLLPDTNSRKLVELEEAQLDKTWSSVPATNSGNLELVG